MIDSRHEPSVVGRRGMYGVKQERCQRLKWSAEDWSLLTYQNVMSNEIKSCIRTKPRNLAYLHLRRNRFYQVWCAQACVHAYVCMHICMNEWMFAGTSSDEGGNSSGNKMFRNTTEQQRKRPASSCSRSNANGKSQIPLRCLVAHRSEAGRRPVADLIARW